MFVGQAVSAPYESRLVAGGAVYCRHAYRRISLRERDLLIRYIEKEERLRTRLTGMAVQEAVQHGAGISARIRLPTSEDIRITAPNVELQSIPVHLTKECLLFYYPETEALARSVAGASEGRVELGEIKWA